MAKIIINILEIIGMIGAGGFAFRPMLSYFKETFKSKNDKTTLLLSWGATIALMLIFLSTGLLTGWLFDKPMKTESRRDDADYISRQEFEASGCIFTTCGSPICLAQLNIAADKVSKLRERAARERSSDRCQKVVLPVAPSMPSTPKFKTEDRIVQEDSEVKPQSKKGYPKLSPDFFGKKIYSLSAFMSEIRNKLKNQVGSLRPYEKDLSKIQSLIDLCPPLMPTLHEEAWYNQGVDRDNYNKSSARQICELETIDSNKEIITWKPFSDNEEQRKIFVEAHSFARSIDESNKATYGMTVYIEDAYQQYKYVLLIDGAIRPVNR